MENERAAVGREGMARTYHARPNIFQARAAGIGETNFYPVELTTSRIGTQYPVDAQSANESHDQYSIIAKKEKKRKSEAIDG